RYSVAMLLLSVSFAFEFDCTKGSCWLSHYNPRKDGTFMFKYVPQNMYITIRELESSAIDYELLDRFPGTELMIAQSPDVKRLQISRNSRLTNLEIMETGIVSIECDLNENLRDLKILSSSLETISRSISNLKNLENLTIQSCPLRELDLGVFCGLKFLKCLYFANSNINSIVSRVKNASCRLAITSIILRANVIRVLNLELFNRCDKLKKMEFKKNKIELVAGRFANGGIRNIDLTWNLISQLNLCQWETPSLVELTLNMNFLSALPACIDKIKSLETIDVSFNNVTHFNSSWLEPMENLIKFDLSYNKIASAIFHSFPKKLKNLKLTESGLKLVDLPNTLVSKSEASFRQSTEVVEWRVFIAQAVVCLATGVPTVRWLPQPSLWHHVLNMD
ncbi:chaoptin-like, partial [Anopheles aquasalis]|uniref:chaoptin-like n=1 Tax=Anopheles aquasalis TaxID=42839 RepID=UPI00215A25EB